MGLFSKVKEAVKGRDEPAKSTTQPAPEQQPSARRPSFADEVTQANRADMHHEPFHGTIHAAQHGQPESALQRNTSKSGAGTFFGLSKLNRQKSTTNGSTATKAAPLVPHQQRPVRVANASSIQDAIGRFCGIRDEDWTGILDLADMISANEAAAKEGAEALRTEIKHGVAQAQERAAKLLVVFMRNANDRFRLKVVEKKFLKTLEETVTAKKLDPRARAMLFKAIAVLAYESQGDSDRQPLVDLYKSIKPSTAPDGGIATEPGDSTFDPVPTKPRAEYASRVQRFDPDRQMDQNIHRATVARSEATMLSETLAYTNAETFQHNDVVKEYHPKLLAWQQWITSEIPWAQAEADRIHREVQPQVTEPNVRAASSPTPSKQEKYLDLLLAANSEVIDALSTYGRYEEQATRMHAEEEELRIVQERSKAETTINRAEVDSEDRRNGFANNVFDSMAPLKQVASTSSSGSEKKRRVAHVFEENLVTQSSSSPPPLRIQSHNPYSQYSSGGSVTSPDSASPMRHFPSEPMLESPSPLVSRNPFYAQPTYGPPRQDSGESGVPMVPSAKALGKLRRFSGPRSAIDTETQQRRLEEQMRKRYEDNYAADQQRKQIPNVEEVSAREEREDPAIMTGTQLRESPKHSPVAGVPSSTAADEPSILDDFDPFRSR